MEKFRKEESWDDFFNDLHKALFDEEEQDVGNDHPCHQYYGHDEPQKYWRERDAISFDNGVEIKPREYKKNY